MAATVLYMSMSLDGFVAGPNETPENGLGDGGLRLHDWLGGDLEQLHEVTGPDGEVIAEMFTTGAVLAGRGTFEPAGGWNGDHHDGVPIFILSRHAAPPAFAQYPLVQYVADPHEAVDRAKAAAGGRNVLVHGVYTASRLLSEGLLDEIQIHLIPVVLGQGRRLFESLPADQVELETVAVVRGADATHLRYRIRR
jgi:dihydrofolate reductase